MRAKENVCSFQGQQRAKLGKVSIIAKFNSEYRILFFEKNPLSIDLPTSIILQVTDTEPAVKGDSVTNITKAATLESGLEGKVPLFIKEGDFIKVDTRSGEYIERVTNR